MTFDMPNIPSAKILYIEDDLGLAELVRIKLKREGYDVAHASIGHQAMMLMHEQPFDAVLIDFYLPDMNGLEVLKAIRALKCKATCIMISGVDDMQLMSMRLSTARKILYLKILRVLI